MRLRITTVLEFETEAAPGSAVQVSDTTKDQLLTDARDQNKSKIPEKSRTKKRRRQACKPGIVV
jgi:hypothetical protein